MYFQRIDKRYKYINACQLFYLFLLRSIKVLMDGGKILISIAQAT